jgi:hypothetical protein
MATEMASDTAALIKEVLPIPESTDLTANAVVDSMENCPTDSHALAMADDDLVMADDDHRNGDKGHHTKQDVVDLGWNQDPSNIADPLVEHLPNEDLWVLTRRFNKQMYHLKETNAPPSGRLDLNTADDQDYSPDKLRSNLERLYMTLVS